MKVVSVVLNCFKNDSRVLKESISLHAAGYDVSVLALHEAGVDEKEVVEGVGIQRLRLKSRSWPKIRVIQLLKYFEFLCLAVLNCRKADVIHCNDLDALPVGVLVYALFNRRVKIVYDAHEFEINDVPHQSALSIRLKFYLERFLIRYASAVLTVSESIADEYVNLYGVQRPTVVLNCPPMRHAGNNDNFRDLLGIRKDQVVFLYQGGLSRGRGIESLLSAFEIKEGDDDVVVFMGYGPLVQRVKDTSDKSNNIYYLPAVSPDVLLDYTSSADYGFLFYENSCKNHDFCSPNKYFEYLMAEVPVVVSNLAEMRGLTEKIGVGVVADTDDVMGVLKSIAAIKAMDYRVLLENIRKVKPIYSWKVQEKKLLEVYSGLFL